jgi:hypothetical protein
VTAMVNGPTSTRAWRNGFDVTTNPSPATAAPGRLVLGGTDGQTNSAAPVSLAELVVYDRVLSDEELWTIQNTLALRNGVASPVVAAPVVSPASNFGNGEVSVSLTTITPRAKIHFTLDGSDPTPSSLVYSGNLSVSRGTTVKARAYLAGAAPSPLATSYYGAAEAHPLPVTDTAMWLRADRGVETHADGSVIRWRDLSGNGNDATPRLASRTPSWIANGFADPIQPILSVPKGASGTLTHAGAIGSDFVVTSPVEITHLGAFDNLSDGFAGTITVRLHAVNDKGTPSLTDDEDGGGKSEGLAGEHAPIFVVC